MAGVIDNSVYPSFFSAFSSGGLARLQHLYLNTSNNWDGAGGQVTIAPGSLPALRTLELACDESDGLVGALLDAAGPHLTSLSARTSSASIAVLAGAAQRDLSWLAGLQKLRIVFWFDDEVFEGVLPEFVVLGLSLLPSLTTLKLCCSCGVQELIVRLLVLLEGGGLPHLTLLEFSSGAPFAMRELGAVLLLALWLKRQAAKGRAEGEQDPVAAAETVLALPFLRGSVFRKSRDTWVRAWIEQCTKQLENAHGRGTTVPQENFYW